MHANKWFPAAIVMLGLSLMPGVAEGEALKGKTATGGPCEIITQITPDPTGSATMSTQIHAGNGQVSGSTTMPGGHSTASSSSTQIRFGDDAPVTASSTSASASSAGGTVTVATAGGKTCTTTAH